MKIKPGVWGYNLAVLFPGNIKAETWIFRFDFRRKIDDVAL
jgi:hypothetical protein